MKILFDHCTPHGLRDYLPEHEVRTAKEEGLHRIKNGELIKTAVDRGFEVLITADKRMRKQEEISGLPLRVVVLTRPNWPAVKTQVGKIQRAVREAEPGRFTTVTTSQKHTRHNLPAVTSELHNQGIPERLQDTHDQLSRRRHPSRPRARGGREHEGRVGHLGNHGRRDGRRRLPRTRGDGPKDGTGGRWGSAASPHTRGWTRRL